MNDVKQLLEDEIFVETDQIKDLEFGSDEYKNSVEGVAKLTDRMIEIEKLELEREDKSLQKKESVKNRIIRACIDIAAIVIPTAVTVWGTKTTMKFEGDDGKIFTTTAGKNHSRKLFK